MSGEQLPYTEQKNPLSLTLSDVSGEEMLQIVVNCHKQIFTENISPSHSLASFVASFDNFCTKAADFLKSSKKTAIVLGGCGTSGRICFLTALNQALYFSKSQIDVIYSIAGGDKAIFKSMELVEDDAVEGKASLERLTKDYDRVVYIGISVGLWAPYVAGQLDYALKHPEKFLPVVIGFNPPHLARNVPINNFHRTFRDVVFEMEQKNHFIISPIILPEALSGSSRMKGGLATIVILDLLFCCLNSKLCDYYQQVSMDKMLASFASMLEYSSLVDENFASFLTFLAEKMRSGGSVFMEGEGVCGILGALDFSEAEPTFNAAPGEVVSCIHWETLDEKVSWHPGNWLKAKTGDECLDRTFQRAFKNAGVSFDENIQRLTERDAFIKLTVCSNDGTPCICFSMPSDPSKTVEFKLDKQLYKLDHLQHFYYQALAKLVLQLASTVVFSQLGKVYKNIMIDVKTGNTKLLSRAIRSVKDVTDCDLGTARRAIIAAVRNADKLCNVDANMSDDDIITASAHLSQVVPCAVVMVLTDCSASEAFTRVRGRGRLCDIVDQLLSARK